jgi:hypothetical protein
MKDEQFQRSCLQRLNIASDFTEKTLESVARNQQTTTVNGF